MADPDSLPLADVLHATAREMRYQGDWWAEVARAAREHIEGPVRALHRRQTFAHTHDPDLCTECWRVYPCPTIRALGGSDGA